MVIAADSPIDSTSGGKGKNYGANSRRTLFLLVTGGFDFWTMNENMPK